MTMVKSVGQMQQAISTDAASLLSRLSDSDTEFSILPGFCDVHVHFREPGFSYKETIGSGSRAAARGGYSAVCTMPNLDPTPDSPAHLQQQLVRIREAACIPVYPYGSITVGRNGREIAALEDLSDKVIAFSDDGSGVQDAGVMREAMLRAKALGKLIAAHCEDNSLLHGGCIHEGSYAAAHGLRGISSASEYAQVERDLQLVEETGCAYHVCHISTAESASLIRQAKRSGLDVSCETAPHYLTLDESCLQDDGRFKMNPPLRSRRDREALLEALLDGTIDMIATDHAPHSAEEKARGLRGSAFGIVGLETAFPVLYTRLVRTGVINLETLLERMSAAPRQRFGIPQAADFSIWNLERAFTVRPEEFVSMGKASPYIGEQLFGVCIATVCGGQPVWQHRRETEQHG